MTRSVLLAGAFTFVLSFLLLAGLLDIGTGQAQAATVAATSYNMYRGPNKSAYVVLSFDDCPKSSAAFKRVITDADKMNIALVLFPTGGCLRSGRCAYPTRVATGITSSTTPFPIRT